MSSRLAGTAEHKHSLIFTAVISGHGLCHLIYVLRLFLCSSGFTSTVINDVCYQSSTHRHPLACLDLCDCCRALNGQQWART